MHAGMQAAQARGGRARNSFAPSRHVYSVSKRSLDRDDPVARAAPRLPPRAHPARTTSTAGGGSSRVSASPAGLGSSGEVFVDDSGLSPHAAALADSLSAAHSLALAERHALAVEAEARQQRRRERRERRRQRHAQAHGHGHGGRRDDASPYGHGGAAYRDRDSVGPASASGAYYDRDNAGVARGYAGQGRAGPLAMASELSPAVAAGPTGVGRPLFGAGDDVPMLDPLRLDSPAGAVPAAMAMTDTVTGVAAASRSFDDHSQVDTGDNSRAPSVQFAPEVVSPKSLSSQGALHRSSTAPPDTLAHAQTAGQHLAAESWHASAAVVGGGNRDSALRPTALGVARHPPVSPTPLHSAPLRDTTRQPTLGPHPVFQFIAPSHGPGSASAPLAGTMSSVDLAASLAGGGSATFESAFAPGSLPPSPGGSTQWPAAVGPGTASSGAMGASGSLSVRVSGAAAAPVPPVDVFALSDDLVVFSPMRGSNPMSVAWSFAEGSSDRVVLEDWLTGDLALPTERLLAKALSREQEASSDGAVRHGPGKPNALTTAVAWGSLDQMTLKMGRYTEFMRTLSAVLKRAVYVRPPGDVVHSGANIRDSSLSVYYRSQTWFARCAVLEHEKQRLVHAAMRLKDQLRDFEKEKEAAASDMAKQAKAKFNWGKLKSKGAKGAGLIGRLKRATTMPPENPIDAVVQGYADLNAEQKQDAMMLMLSDASHGLRLAVLKRMVMTVRQDQVTRVVAESYEEKPSLRSEDLSTMVLKLMSGDKIREDPMERVTCVNEMLDYLDEDEFQRVIKRVQDMVKQGRGSGMDVVEYDGSSSRGGRSGGRRGSQTEDRERRMTRLLGIKEQRERRGSFADDDDGRGGRRGRRRSSSVTRSRDGDPMSPTGGRTPTRRGGPTSPSGAGGGVGALLRAGENVAKLARDSIAAGTGAGDGGAAGADGVAGAAGAPGGGGASPGQLPGVAPIQAFDEDGKPLAVGIPRPVSAVSFGAFGPASTAQLTGMSALTDATSASGSASAALGGANDALMALLNSADLSDEMRQQLMAVQANIVQAAVHASASGDGDGGGGGGGGGVKGGRKRQGTKLPWARYMKGPSGKVRGQKPKKSKLSQVATMVYECYQAKLVSNTKDDHQCKMAGSILRANFREPLPEFIRDVLLRKFGMPSMADAQLYAIVDACKKNAASNARFRLFGIMVGVVETSHYSPRLCDLVLNIYQHVFPRLSAATLRNRKVGACYVELTTMMAALEETFPETHEPVSVDTMLLTEGRRDTFFAAVNAMAKTRHAVNAEAKGKKEAAAAAATPGSASVGSQRKLLSRSGSRHGADGDDDEDEDGGTAEIHDDTLVVDADSVLTLFEEVFQEQVAADKNDMQDMWDAYDDDGNGALSLEEFRDLIMFCTTEDVDDSDILTLFKEMQSYDQDDGDTPDEVSPEAFQAMCFKHGITSPSLASIATASKHGARSASLGDSGGDSDSASTGRKRPGSGRKK